MGRATITDKLPLIIVHNQRLINKVEESTSIAENQKGKQKRRETAEKTSIVTRNIEHYVITGSTADEPKGGYVVHVELLNGKGNKVSNEVVTLCCFIASSHILSKLMAQV